MNRLQVHREKDHSVYIVIINIYYILRLTRIYVLL